MVKRLLKNPILLATVVSQVITLLLSTVFTRIFTPEEFGLYYSYAAIFSLLLVIARVNNDTQILKARTSQEIDQIKKTGILHVRALVLLIGITLLLGYFFMELSIIWFSLIPGLLGYVFYWQWYNQNLYEKNIKKAGSLRLQDTLFSNGLRFIKFLSVPGGYALILAQSFSPIIILLGWRNSGLLKNLFHFKQFWIKPKKDNFHLSIGQIANTGIFQLPLFVLGVILENEFVGFLGLSFKMVRLPISVLGIAITDQFKSTFSDLIRSENYHKGQSYLKSTLKMLIGISLIITIGLTFLSPYAFSLFFGDNWETAGNYAQILAIPFSLAIIASPLTFIFYLADLSKVYTKIQLIHFVLLAGIFIPMLLSPNAHWMPPPINIVIGLSFIYTLNYSIIIYQALKVNRKHFAQ